jgi:hypothetical protein
MLAEMKRVCILVIVCFLVGCGRSTLETGYKPRKLGASGVERRSYYASPFTPEARAAQLERQQEQTPLKPTPGH